MTEKILHFNGSDIFYTIYGDGVPAVFIHGFAEDSNVWKYQVDALAKNYTVIVPDLPGSGQSAPVEDMSIEGMAECIKQLLEQELIANEEAIIIGHSMGGYITLALAEKYPEQIRAIGLFHSGAFADTEEKKTTRQRGIVFIETHGSHEFLKQSVPNLFGEEYRMSNYAEVEKMIEQYANFNPQALVAYYNAMMQRPDRTAVLKSFKKPVLFIIGRHDKAIPFEDSMKQCHLPQQSRINILEHSAHMGMWEEKEKSLAALISFLDDVVA